MQINDCPCCSGKTYSECCEPVIKNESATTALALMRSRFSAYKICNAQYIYNTTHVNNREENKLEAIEQWAKETSWEKLEIVSVEHGNINSSRGIVEFKAFFKDKNQKDHILHERSTFLKEEGKWYYHSGLVNPPKIDLMKKVLRNDPCPCGSGKKQKKCCGQN